MRREAQARQTPTSERKKAERAAPIYPGVNTTSGTWNRILSISNTCSPGALGVCVACPVPVPFPPLLRTYPGLRAAISGSTYSSAIGLSLHHPPSDHISPTNSFTRNSKPSTQNPKLPEPKPLRNQHTHLRIDISTSPPKSALTKHASSLIFSTMHVSSSMSHWRNEICSLRWLVRSLPPMSILRRWSELVIGVGGMGRRGDSGVCVEGRRALVI